MWVNFMAFKLDLNRIVPPHPFCFLQFQLPAVNPGLPILNKKFRNKQFVSFKRSPILGSTMKSHTFLLCPAGNHPAVQCFHALHAACILVT